MRGLTLELHFSVAGYGGHRLPFHGITVYLHGLVSVFKRPIVAGSRVWTVHVPILCYFLASFHICIRVAYEESVFLLYVHNFCKRYGNSV